ncbi:alpha/beta hydrolase [Alcanivorax sp. JB21]|uniref:alpha/beta hydrolase n=1 Tax=Alcanivorax limicola TaxID=2874102 RepID=UPI001CC11A64|nr:alpha/beta hydrolase [Alcanivorax limicola]MBZ2189725.1 alpha/beta hydrolase [Alcanivorax limicola]
MTQRMRHGAFMQMRVQVRVQARVLVTVLVIVITSVSCSNQQRVDTAPQAQKGLVFSPPEWPQTLRADLHRPEGDGPHAAVLLVHGGGWAGRSRDDMTGIAEQLAEAGYVALNIDYRFAPDYTFPAQLHDLQIAMAWLHDNAETLAIDTARIGALGYSSGAHLVSLLGLVAGQGDALDAPYGGAMTRPAAVVAGGTPTDLRKFRGGGLVPQFVGATQSEAPQAYVAVSPVSHVHADAPPFLLFHGSLDRTVPLDHATDFVDALAAAGGDVTFYQQPRRGHITSFLLRGGAMEEVLAFFAQHLGVPDPL